MCCLSRKLSSSRGRMLSHGVWIGKFGCIDVSHVVFIQIIINLIRIRLLNISEQSKGLVLVNT